MNHLAALTSLAQSFWLPKSASTMAPEHDMVFDLILYVTGFFFFIVVGCALFFIIRYRRRGDSLALTNITHNTPLEIAWTGIPLILVIMFFVMGFRGYLKLDTPPSDSIVINVRAQKWSFSFTYPQGGISNNLYVPKDKNVVLLMTSDDVTHALFIPAFRVQRNILPRRTTSLWFNATEFTPSADYSGNPNDPGGFTIFCTQYCGDKHSYMGSGQPDKTLASYVYVQDPATWDKTMARLADLFHTPDGKDRPYKEVGQRLYQISGCAGCHSVDGKENTGPTWQGLYKRPEKMSDGSTLPVVHPDLDASGQIKNAAELAANDKIWDDYLHESILQPGAKIVFDQAHGHPFANAMPSSYAANFDGSDVNHKKMAALIEYIKSVGDPKDYRPMPAPTSSSQPAGAPATAPGK